MSGKEINFNEVKTEPAELLPSERVDNPALQKIPAASDLTPMGLVAHAMSCGANLEQLEKFMDLAERFNKVESEKAYNNALAEFKANPPRIYKDKNVSFGNTNYNHAQLGDLSIALGEALGVYGLSISWRTDQANNRVKVTCRLSHKLGHFEETSLEASPDDSGKKNQIQQVASTVTYLQRYTAITITGVAPVDLPDDDGRGVGANRSQKEQAYQNQNVPSEIAQKWIDWIYSFCERTLDEFNVAWEDQGKKALEAFKGYDKKAVEQTYKNTKIYLEEQI